MRQRTLGIWRSKGPPSFSRNDGSDGWASRVWCLHASHHRELVCYGGSHAPIHRSGISGVDDERRRQTRRTGSPARKTTSGVSMRRTRCASDPAGSSEIQDIGVTAKSGGHPNPRAGFLLPERVFPADQHPFGDPFWMWLDAAQHFGRFWESASQAFEERHDLADIVIVKTRRAGMATAIDTWHEADRVRDGSLTCPPAHHARRRT